MFSSDKKNEDSIDVLEDQKWVDLLLKGDTNGFVKLYDKYSNRIYSFFCSKVKNIELANDLSQQVWEKVYKNINYYDSGYKFSTWLYAISSNILIDDIRKKSKFDLALNKFIETNPKFNEPEVKNEFEANEVLGSIAKISRELLELRYLKEMSFQEISKLKGLTEVNVRKIISRSIKKIKKQK